MPNDLSSDLLAQALGRTMEDAAFVFAEATSEPPPFDGDVIEARLTYVGTHAGELLLATPATFAATLAANLLGEDEGGASVTGDDLDAVGELLNMIAGKVAVDLFGPDAPCKLGLPRVQRVRAEQHERALATAQAATTMVEEEGRRIDLSACVTSGKVPGAAP